MAAGRPFAYQWRDAVLLRATTFPDGPEPVPDVDLSGRDDVAGDLKWLSAVWQRPRVREALSVASPGLCRQLEELLAEESPDSRRVRRVTLSAAAYMLRWRERPTPFGLFAGVAPAGIGTAARVSWGGAHRSAARADAGWLAAVARRLHQCPELLERLHVVANDAGQLRGSRYVVPGSPGTGHQESLAPVEVSVRCTRPVAAALEAARSPVRYGDLRELVSVRFPDAAPARIDVMLTGLVTRNFLVTSLQAPGTVPDALGHLLAALGHADADDILAVSDLVRELGRIHDQMAGASARTAAPGRADLAARMSSLCGDVPMPLVIDTVLDCDVQIPAEVAREAQEAFSVLYRLTPQPFGSRHWIAYHASFRARYGTGAVVPVLDLVADSGLGMPAGYLGSGTGRAARPLTARDEKIFALIQQAMLADLAEIVLTEQMIADLAVGDDAEFMPVPRAEMAFQIHAVSPDALSRGAFRLVVTGTPWPGSSMAGRFVHLLPDDTRRGLAATYPAADEDALTAQLSFAPRRLRNDNITRTAQLLPWVIPLSEHRTSADGVIPVTDLAVTADARRFYLVHVPTGRLVEPHIPHCLEITVQTPPLARFLAEIPIARSAAYRSFDFGAASGLPYLPAVRYKRTVLSQARWLLTAADLPGRTAPMTRWEAGLDQWRARLGVPGRVTMVQHEQRLPLDLGRPAHRLLLRTRMDSAQRIELREAPSPADLAWLGRPHELLLPLTLRSRLPARQARPPGATAAGQAHLPGRSPVLRAHVHGHPARFDEILTGHLPALVSSWETPPRCWFRRHRDTTRPDAGQYLEICLRLPGARCQCAGQLSDWAARLRDLRLVSGLTLMPYEPQCGRYGHGPAIEAAEAFFAADSAAALAQITAASRGGVSAQALAAASITRIATGVAGTAAAAAHWLRTSLPREQGRAGRDVRDQALRLADPDRAHDELRPAAAGMQVASAWQARAAALAAYRDLLAAQRDPLSVLPALIHEHHLRATPADPDAERETRRLARAWALSYTARLDT